MFYQQLHEWMGDYAAAIRDRQRILKCLREEYKTTSGEGIDSQKREIERLERKKRIAES